MEITEVRIKLMEEPGERLKAFCSITFDNCFVVRDLKIIEGASGPFVAMPSRKLTFHCPRCRAKNHLRAQHCNQCGEALSADRLPLDQDGRTKLYADIAHPINSSCREMIQDHVIQEFHEEIERAKQPDYVSRYDDFDVDDLESRRVDPPHGQHRAHAPRSGGTTEPSSKDTGGPVPTEKSSGKPPTKSPSKSPSALSAPSADKPPQKEDGNFGAGIL